MIVQEIKLYDEPANKKQTQQSGVFYGAYHYNNYTPAMIDNYIKQAVDKKIYYGRRFKRKDTGRILVVASFERDVNKIDEYNKEPMFILAHYEDGPSANQNFHYSMEELTDTTKMEALND